MTPVPSHLLHLPSPLHPIHALMCLSSVFFGWQNFVASSKALLTLEDARRNGQKYEGAAVPGIHVLGEPAASRYQQQATGTRGGVGLVDQTLIAANYL